MIKNTVGQLVVYKFIHPSLKQIHSLRAKTHHREQICYAIEPIHGSKIKATLEHARIPSSIHPGYQSSASLAKFPQSQSNKIPTPDRTTGDSHPSPILSHSIYIRKPPSKKEEQEKVKNTKRRKISLPRKFVSKKLNGS